MDIENRRRRLFLQSIAEAAASYFLPFFQGTLPALPPVSRFADKTQISNEIGGKT
jgi:hypothetical protein